MALGTHAAADTLNLQAAGLGATNNFGSATGTVVDIFNVTAAGNILAGATLSNKTAQATGNANLANASGYVFLKNDAGGAALTSTSAAALFSTTTNNFGTWNIATGTQKEILIEHTNTGTGTTDVVWQITETAGVFTAQNVTTVGVVAAHDVTYANFA